MHVNKEKGFAAIFYPWPSEVPYSWRECGQKATARARVTYSGRLPEQWMLVLEAKKIPYYLMLGKDLLRYCPRNGLSGYVPLKRKMAKRISGAALSGRRAATFEQACLFVPSLYACLAEREIAAYLCEPPLKPQIQPEPLSETNFSPLLVVLLGLLLFHALRFGVWGGLGLSPEQWAQAGSLSSQAVAQKGEWYRLLTALTLHADSQHLLGNLVFGGIVLAVLSLRLNAWSAIFLAFVAGVMGNLLAVLLRFNQNYASLGSSTALFGAMGVLCGLAVGAWHSKDWRRLFLPLATGFAWLAFLGTEGERVDILAHFTGLISGFGLGFGLSFFDFQKLSNRFGKLMALLSGFAVFLAWLMALNTL